MSGLTPHIISQLAGRGRIFGIMELSQEQRANALARNTEAKKIKPPPTVVDWDKAIARLYEIFDEVYHPAKKKKVKK